MGGLGLLHHRASPPACGRGPQKGAPASEPDDHAIGRSRGGLTTKIHLAADARCRPLAFVLTAGQAGDAPAFADVMARLRVPRQRGRPRTRPDVVLADKAYSSRAIRDHLRRRGIRAVIPVPADQRGHRLRRGRRGGRPAGLRPRDLQATQHRRAVHQPPQTVARASPPATRRQPPPTSGLHIAGIFLWSAGDPNETA
ncbi:transposase [Streptomyces nigra]|uniref:transposase n=1 Tax=Streptomyces nigra TaxID=1827580 RepID=UPI0037F11B6F